MTLHFIWQVSRNPNLGGASVIGLVYEGGVMIAADCLTSYGSMARFREFPRVWKVNKNTLVGVGGDMADFQHVWKSIQQKQIDDESTMDGKCSGPLALHTWLTRLQYNKRCKFEPYWVEWLVAGMQDGKPFLGYVNRLGTSYQSPAIGTGRLGQLAVPLLSEYIQNFNGKLDEQKAKEMIIQAMKILYLRDCYTSNKYLIGVISNDKEARVEGPFGLETNWEVALLNCDE